MNTQQLIDVLNAHRKIITVELGAAKDCKEFWEEFRNKIFYSLPPENNIDGKMNEALYSFGQSDTLEIVNKKGRILKRFANFYKIMHGEALTNEMMGKLGDVLQYYLQKSANVFYADFIDTIDWNNGQFGKSDSCWWGCYGQSREVFTDNGGWGIRFYEDDNQNDDNGIGRTWILPRDGMLICFNSYGVSRAMTSKVIKSIFKDHGITLHYQVASIENSRNSEIPYINGDSGFILYSEGMENVPDNYDINMHVEDDDTVECYNCGRRVDNDASQYINDDTYCDRCVSDLFSYCESCCEYYSQDDVHQVQDSRARVHYLCESCASDKGFVRCYECNQYTQDYNLDEDGDSYCESCTERELHYCESCDEYSHHEHEHNEDEDSSSDTVSNGLDTSGLVESLETVNIKAKDTVDHAITIYRVEGIKGIFLYNYAQLDKKLKVWMIAHDKSGLAVKSDIESFDKAKELLIRLAPMINWNVDAEQIYPHAELLQQAFREVLS